MTYIYLFYGLAFIASGLILGLQARLPFAVVPRRALALLSAFALVHGAAEWIFMWMLIENAGQPLPRDGRIAAATMNALSFGLLLQFGIELWATLTGKPRWIRLAPAMPTILVVVLVARVASSNGGTTPIEVEAIVRYGLAFGASLFSAYGLLLVRRTSMKTVTPRTRQLLIGGSLAFVAYAVLAGLVVPPAPFFPASRFNTASFLALTGVPVEAFRALCAVALAWILSEIFVIEVSRSKAEEARLREEFISVIAHELRSPISTIDLTAELIERKFADDQTGAALRQELERIHVCSHRIDRMIGDLLDASRIEARRLSLVPKPTDMRVLLLAVVDRSAALCAGHPVRVQLPEQISPVRADADRVEQILTNLLSNAGKYAREGTEIVVGVTAEPRHLELAVSSVGEELDPKEAEQLFARFYRAKGAARRAPGLGVGLYIAKGLVEAHGGRIWVESEGGRTTFRFTLPLTGSAPVDPNTSRS